MAATRDSGSVYARLGLLIGLNTLVLTTAFVGILALVSGYVVDLSARVPWYVMVAALAFVVIVVTLEQHEVAGRTVIVTGTVLSVVGFGVVLLLGEGIRYAVQRPEDVFVSQLLVYFLSAGLIATGLGYWALRHWREYMQ